LIKRYKERGAEVYGQEVYFQAETETAQVLFVMGDVSLVESGELNGVDFDFVRFFGVEEVEGFEGELEVFFGFFLPDAN
jgi:hypothetical protein